MLEKMLEDKKNKRTLIWIIIFILLFVTFLVLPKKEIKNSEIKRENYNEQIEKLFDKISKNYNLSIKLFKNEREYELEYFSDGIIEMYSSNDFSKKGYLIFENNIYYLENDELVKTNESEIENIFNKKLFDLEFIKKIVNKCDIERVSKIRKKCTLNSKDFLILYDETLNNNDNGQVDIEIIHDDSKIRCIIMEYSNVFSKDEKIQYVLELSNIDSNDFSEYKKIIIEKYN